jgi:ATP-binding cassette subfamily B (MDR/TAP) protein 9
LSDGKNQITSGQLVSFLLYLSSLSEAFGSMGGIWTALSRAVGGADKVFELMHRKPKRKERVSATERRVHKGGLLGNDMYQTERFRSSGLHPVSCTGLISFESVNLFYPARPQRQVLQDLTFTAYPGQVVALVGMSVRKC